MKLKGKKEPVTLLQNNKAHLKKSFQDSFFTSLVKKFQAVNDNIFL